MVNPSTPTPSTPSGLIEPLLVPHRFCGPPASGNGGWTAGALARRWGGDLGTTYTITLRQPPPLETEMSVQPRGDALVATHDGQIVAEGALSTTALEPPPEFVSYADAEAAEQRFGGRTFHPFSTCFTCGTDRPDGLKIFPGEIDLTASGLHRVAGTWTPDESVTDDRQHASYEVTWAALDCTGGWAGGLADTLMVLGQMTTTVHVLPEIGVPLIVVGEAQNGPGRKTMARTAIYTPRQVLIGQSDQVWISVNPKDFGAAER